MLVVLRSEERRLGLVSFTSERLSLSKTELMWLAAAWSLYIFSFFDGHVRDFVLAFLQLLMDQAAPVAAFSCNVLPSPQTDKQMERQTYAYSYYTQVHGQISLFYYTVDKISACKWIGKHFFSGFKDDSPAYLGGLGTSVEPS